ncbi:endonuclease III [Clostridium sp. D2Q-14]|uniref:endonuclease III n=1 Tax=Anaeromonas gelatinilytica TaxID=2683194 RepID=UPI00193C7299|nr:endonuclease III [Anaeromonas gelatinilytica]MBS4536590.1 endonuclease III [Anaeromonas gelatinilytica]
MKGKLDRNEIDKVLDILKDLYPDAQSELNFTNPFELLIATILSAQSTDKRVNLVTSDLFKKYKTPKDFLSLNQEELGAKIKSIGFYRNKSKNILNTCRILVEEYDSQVPNNREDLMKLPGVGRKTANVVMSNAFGEDAIAVDTHVFRVSNRIGIADSDNVKDTEIDLMNNINKELWSDAHHWLIFHGRRICKARKPRCEECPLIKYCLYYKNVISK